MVMPPDFSREVYCILGLPFDAITMSQAVQHLQQAAINRTPCFLATPNLNLLIGCQSDAVLRNSMINSNLSVADGMPIVWIARLLGIPIQERVAGSDVFNQLAMDTSKQLSVYFYGGMEGVAETACTKLNSSNSSGLRCAGFEYPGFGSVKDMSTAETISKINASNADFLVVSLGAKKGTAWIENNHSRISVPLISHLGAVINFVAGTVNRAPVWSRRFGLEWLWRIKEEPGLWRRYATDGWSFIKLLLTRVIPYAWFNFWHQPEQLSTDSSCITVTDNGSELTICLSGIWVHENLQPLRKIFTKARLAGKKTHIDMKLVTYIDSAFIGLLLLYYAHLSPGEILSIVNVNDRLRPVFRYTCTEYLLD